MLIFLMNYSHRNPCLKYTQGRDMEENGGEKTENSFESVLTL